MVETGPEAQDAPKALSKRKLSPEAVYVRLRDNLRPAEFAALKFLAKTPKHDETSRTQLLRLLRKGLSMPETAGKSTDIHKLSAQLNRLFDAVEGRTSADFGAVRAAPPTRPRKSLLRKVSDAVKEVVLGPAEGVVPPPTQPRGKSLRRGAFLGIILTVLPLATAFAIAPIDGLLGLSQYDFIPVLAQSHPALASAAAVFQQYILGMAITLGGLSAVFAGLLGKPSRTPAEKLVQLKRLIFRIALPGTLLAAGIIGGMVLNMPILALVPGIILNLLSTIVMATGEEVVFRQWLFRKMLGKWDAGKLRFWSSLLLSSAVFSVLHVVVHGFTLHLFVLKALLGALFGLAYYRTRSIAAPAAMHSAYNIFVNPSMILMSPFFGSPFAAAAGWTLFALATLLTFTLFPKNGGARAPPAAAWKDDTPAGVAQDRAAEILAGLAKRAGFSKTPKLEIVASRLTQARAHKSPRKIVVTTPLLAMFNERELAAVLAHELGHLHRGTWRVAKYVALPPLLMKAGVLLALMPFDIFPWNFPIAGMACLLTLFWGVRTYFSQEEFAADSFAERLMGEGLTLATVLSKLPGSLTDPQVPPRIRRLLTPGPGLK